MKDFDYEVMQKKRIAYSAKHKKGTKSKKCSLSTDKMTKKQWLERCGSIVSVNLNQPITWQEFKNLSTASKEAYVDGIIEKFGANKSAFARMFQRDPSLINKTFNNLGFKDKWKGYNKMTRDQSQAFQEFINSNNNVSNDIDTTPSVPVEQAVTQQVTASQQPMRPERFAITFCGILDAADISAQIASIVTTGVHAKLTIDYEVIHEE